MNKYYIVLFSSVFVCFLLGGSLAWLNPRPGFVPAYRISEKIPFLWQYDKDSRSFIDLASDFPHDFDSGDHVRVSRPLYPALAKLLGSIAMSCASLFVDYGFMEDIELAEAALGFILVKLIFFSVFVVLCFRLMSYFFDPNISLFATLLILFGIWPIKSIGTYHTYEAQFIIPLIVTLSFFYLSRNYSHIRNIGLSFAAGILLLIKPVFSVYLACVLVALMTRNLRKISLSVLIAAVPTIIWSLYSASKGWVSAQSSGDISFYLPVFLNQILAGEIITIGKKFQTDIQQFINSMAFVYTIWIIPACLGLREVWKVKLDSNIRLYIVCLIVLTWFQASVAGMTHHSRMTTDYSFLILGGAAYYVLTVTRRKQIPDRWVIAVCVSLWIAWTLVTVLNLPWVHPYNQVPVNRLS